MKLKSIQKAIEELSQLPTIGERTAFRLILFLLKQPKETTEGISQALLDIKERIRFCSSCFGLSEEPFCHYCTDPQREIEKTLCIVEQPQEIFSIENCGRFAWKYHVLHGLLSPMDGIGPEDLKISQLIMRTEKEGIKEVVLAINPSLEGEATALYLQEIFKKQGIQISRIANGIPVGSSLEYLDQLTIGKALENRIHLNLS